MEARRGHLVESTLKAQDEEKLAVDRVKEKEIQLLDKQKEVEELKKIREEEEILQLRIRAEREEELFKLQKQKLEAEVKLLQFELKEKVIIY